MTVIEMFGGGGGSSLPSLYEAHLLADHTSFPANAWTNINNCSIVIPAGTYFVVGRAVLVKTAAGNYHIGVGVHNGSSLLLASIQSTLSLLHGSATVQGEITVAASTTLTLQGRIESNIGTAKAIDPFGAGSGWCCVITAIPVTGV